MFARIWRRIERDLEARHRLFPLLPSVFLFGTAWALEYFDAPEAIQNWIGVPLLTLAVLWALYVKGMEIVWLRRLGGHGKFRSERILEEPRNCPDCLWDLPEDFDTSHGALNECPQCGARLDRSGHLF